MHLEALWPLSNHLPRLHPMNAGSTSAASSTPMRTLTRIYWDLNHLQLRMERALDVTSSCTPLYKTVWLSGFSASQAGPEVIHFVITIVFCKHWVFAKREEIYRGSWRNSNHWFACHWETCHSGPHYVRWHLACIYHSVKALSFCSPGFRSIGKMPVLQQQVIQSDWW